MRKCYWSKDMKLNGKDIKINMRIEEDKIVFNDTLSITIDEFEAISKLVRGHIKEQVLTTIRSIWDKKINDVGNVVDCDITNEDGVVNVNFNLNSERLAEVREHLSEHI